MLPFSEFHVDEIWLKLSATATAVILIFGLVISRIVSRMRGEREFFLELFSNISNGVAIFKAIGDGRDFVLTDINAAAETLEKISKEKSLGKSVNDLLRHAVEFDLVGVFRRVWTTGNSESFPPRFWLRSALIHYVFKLPSGEIVTVYTDEHERRHMEMEIRRRVDEIGKLMRQLSCLYEISKLAEEPAITFEEIIQKTVERIPAAWQHPFITCVRVVAGDKEFTTDNFRETPWMQRENIVMDGVPAGFIEVGYLEERQAQDEGPFLKGERALIQIIAERLGRSLKLKYAQDAVALHVRELERVNRDLKETRAELIQMGKLSVMGKMAAELAHEINNPLGAIRIHIDGLRRDIDSGQLLPSDVGKALDSIGKSIGHIAQAVYRMRLFSRQSDEKYEALDLSRVVADVIEMLRPQMEKDGIRLAEDYSQVPLVISGNANMLEQLFTNIVLNARDAIDSKGTAGTITVITRMESDGGVSAVVSDDGKGMEPEVKAQIFSPFFTTKEKGVGLGMAIVRRILDLHQGRIGVESAPESGSTFTISFPKDRLTVES
ncbi:MAG: ATP-binding protein [bacterium]